jgi:EF hand
MNFKSLLVLTASFAIAFGAIASEVKKGDKDSDGTLDKAEAKAFPKLLKADKDSDGTLDKKEIKDKKIAKAFDQIDTDADGTIDAKELAAYFEKAER